jgi:hypothetical protein
MSPVTNFKEHVAPDVSRSFFLVGAKRLAAGLLQRGGEELLVNFVEVDL